MSSTLIRCSERSSPHGTERWGYLDVGDSQIFASVVAPDRPTGDVLVCSPICNEFVKHYRREVVVARTLAEQGWRVTRFHYRGVGNSGGEWADTTFDRLVEDARAVATHAGALVPSSSGRTVWLGTRFGALVAAAAAERDHGFVGLEPVTEGRRFFREGLRARLIYGVRSGESAAAANELTAAMKSQGWIDIMGDPVYAPLYDSAEALVLDRLACNGLAGALLVQLGAGEQLRPALAATADRLANLGVPVSVSSIALKETWWFNDDRKFLGLGSSESTEAAPVAQFTTRLAAWLDDLVGEVAP